VRVLSGGDADSEELLADRGGASDANEASVMAPDSGWLELREPTTLARAPPPRGEPEEEGGVLGADCGATAKGLAAVSLAIMRDRNMFFMPAEAIGPARGSTFSCTTTERHRAITRTLMIIEC
jgi:hypothetical protein